MSANPAEDVDTSHHNVSTDDDSGAEFDDWSSTDSLEDFVSKYIEENGRTYNSYGGEYWAPNDDEQCEHMDIAHEFFSRLLDGRLFLAPIDKNLHNVLDLGTGTGTWAIELADERPSAHVVGVDLSPIQPAWVPGNCSFQVYDLNEPWTFESDMYDLVHIRNLLGGICNWTAFYKQIYNSLKPGAYIEQLEYSVHFKSDRAPFKPSHTLSTWSSLLIEAGELTGKTMAIAEMAKTLITEAGFINIVERIYKVPFRIPRNRRATAKERDIKNWNLFQFEKGMEGFALRFLTKHLKWEYNEVQVLLDQMRNALHYTNVQIYYNVHVIYGQKPLQ